MHMQAKILMVLYKYQPFIVNKWFFFASTFYTSNYRQKNLNFLYTIYIILFFDIHHKIIDL